MDPSDRMKLLKMIKEDRILIIPPQFLYGLITQIIIDVMHWRNDTIGNVQVVRRECKNEEEFSVWDALVGIGAITIGVGLVKAIFGRE